MLVYEAEDREKSWVYLEVPRTGSTTITYHLRQLYPDARAVLGKHWPVTSEVAKYISSTWLISLREPFQRAVSCWRFFTVPGQIKFSDWLEVRLQYGFCDDSIEARPQWYWWKMLPVEGRNSVIYTETLASDLYEFVLENGGVWPAGYSVKRQNQSGSSWRNRKGHVTPPLPGKWYDVYTGKDEARVRELYSDDFREELGFSCDFESVVRRASLQPLVV